MAACASFNDFKWLDSATASPSRFTDALYTAVNTFEVKLFDVEQLRDSLLPLQELAELVGSDYEDVIHFVRFTPKDIDYRTLGGTASQFVNNISQADYDAMTPEDQTKVNHTRFSY